MRITDIVWKERTVEKLSEKHSVSVADAEETLLSRPVVRKIARGRVRGEDVYAVLAQIETGRDLVVFFIHKKHGIALPISARYGPFREEFYDKHK